MKDQHFTTHGGLGRLALVLVLALLVVGRAEGSEIVLVSGERLVGTVKEIRDATIVFEHAHLGTLEIKLSAIRLIDGGVPPTPKVKPAPPPRPARDEQPVRSDADAPVLPAGRQGLRAEAAGRETRPAAEIPSAEDDGVEWSSNLELGASTRQGRADDFSGRVRLEMTRADLRGQIRLDGAYRYATARSDRIENEFSAGAFAERKTRKERLTLFAQSRFDADEFQSWDRRLTASSGLGIRLLEVTEISPAGAPRTLFTFTHRIGAGFRQEYGDVDETVIPEGLASLEIDLRISPRQTFTVGSTIYPDLRDSEKYRLLSTAGWSIAIDQLDGISLRLGMSHEYDSITEGDIAHNDLSAFAAIVFSF